MFRRIIEEKFWSLWEKYPVISLTGPRQSGKTTLLRMLNLNLPYVSLEDPDERQIAMEDPRGFLSNYPEGAIFDEVQRAPHLFSYIQTLVDEGKVKFVLSGSQNFQLMESISQSLAGRTAILRLLPLSMTEIPDKLSLHSRLFSGAYPAIYDRQIPPVDYYPSYISTYVERDVRQIQNIENLHLFQRFLQLCAGRIGQPLNYASLANDTGISPNSAKQWLSILEAGYIIHFLQPYYKNFNKRITKSPKLYFYDTGVLSSLLGIESPEQLSSHYLIGNIFENFVANEFLKYRTHRGMRSNLYFWQDKQKKEVDLLVDFSDQIHAVEIKAGATKSSSYFSNLKFWQKVSDTEAEYVHVVYGGDKSLRLQQGHLWSWQELPEMIHSLHNG